MEKPAFAGGNPTTPRILIVRVGAMGDVIHALPAVAMLRDALPGAQIGWAIEPRWAPLLRAERTARRDPVLMPLVDAVHLVEAKQWNRHPFSLATLRSIAALRRELRASRYDIAIDLQGSLRSAVISRVSGAKQVIGSKSPRESIASLLYRTRVPRTAAHVSDQAVELVQAALKQFFSNSSSVLSTGAGQFQRPTEWRNLPLLLPREPDAEAWWQQQRPTLCAGSAPILLAATAGWGAKEWPPANFSALAAELAGRGHSVLLNTTPGGIDPITAHVLQQIATYHPNAAAHVHPLPATLPQLIAATREMLVVIAGDTGPLHLAEVLGVPTVGIFGPTDPARTGTRYRAICLRDPDSITDHRRHTQVEPGLARISVAQVMEAFHAVVHGH